VAGLSVRRIDNDVYERLRARAQRHGVSMEEEVRRILRAAVRAPERLGDAALSTFGEYGEELHIPERDVQEPARFDS
jgi:antitoxin FitA